VARYRHMRARKKHRYREGRRTIVNVEKKGEFQTYKTATNYKKEKKRERSDKGDRKARE